MDYVARSEDRELGVRPRAEQTASALGAVSWGAIVAGAAGAASLSLILLILGVGLGFSAVSPWSGHGISAATFGVSTIAWLTFTQIFASVLGGYLAGRLRTKWSNVASDEVYFRDTAHGFLAWAIASLVTAAALTSATASIVSGGAQAGAAVAGGAIGSAAMAMQGSQNTPRVTSAGDADPLSYYTDALLRPDPNARPGSTGGVAAPVDGSRQSTTQEGAELARIFRHAGMLEPLPPADVQFAGQIVASRTGLSQADAEKRVTDTYARAQAALHDAGVAAQQAADKARKATAYASLWLFVSLLIGAFVSSFSATFGGRLRDR